MIAQPVSVANVPEAASGLITFSQFLPTSELTCAPAPGTEQHEFHWLAYVPRGKRPQLPLKVECELWRWHDGQWRSVFVPGTRFTPSELHDQGWRYCKPCEPLVAVVRS